MYRRLRSAVAQRLRARLLPADEPVLEPFPAGGLSRGRATVRPYVADDAPARLALELSPGMDQWRSAYATPK